jgi:hypothetical protein
VEEATLASVQNARTATLHMSSGGELERVEVGTAEQDDTVQATEEEHMAVLG